MWSTRETVGSAPSVPSLPIPIREDVVDTPRRSPDDRIPPGDSFSDPTKDPVSGASPEGVASIKNKSSEVGVGIQSEEWGELGASNEITSAETWAEGIQFQEAVEVVASNEMVSQVAENEIQFQEAGEAVAFNEITSHEAGGGIQSHEVLPAIQSGATASPSGNVSATNSCCIIL